MQLRIVIIVLSSSFLLSACTSVISKLPVTRLDSPEVVGETAKLGGALGVGSTRDVVLSSDASSRPPDVTHPSVADGGEALGKVGVGIWKKFEVGLRGGLLLNTPWTLSGKFQILGEPALSAKAYNFSLAVTAALGYGNQKNSGDQRGVFGPGGYKWKSEINTYVQDYAVIAGYRLTDTVLIYGGGYYSSYRLGGNVHDDRSDDATSPAADYSISGTGQNYGANLGFQFFFGKGFYGAVEGTTSTFQWTSLNSETDVYFGGVLGANF
jgi:hypothetical protein